MSLPPPDLTALARSEPVLVELASSAAGAGVEIWLVGGAVRDHFLGLPHRDLDFVLVAPPHDGGAFLEHQAAAWGRRVLTFDIRGLKERRIPLPGGDLDFVLTPPGSLEDELLRRDFTLNAMAVRLPDGQLADPAGGRADLAAHLLRMTGPDVLAEDPLRALRAVRFLAEGRAAHLDPATGTAMQRVAGQVAGCAAERITAELDRMAVSGGFAPALQRLQDLGLLRPLLTEVADLAGVSQNLFHHRDVLGHTLEAVALADDPATLAARVSGPAPAVPGGEDRAVLAWAVLAHDLGKPATRSVGDDGRVHFYGHEKVSAKLTGRMAARLRFSRRRTARVTGLVLHHLRAGAIGPGASLRALRRLVHDVGDDLDLYLLLSLADMGATRGPGHQPRQRDLAATCSALLEVAAAAGEALLRPRPLLDGRAAMALTGLPPGPRLGGLLRELLRLQVEGEISSRAEAEAELRRLTREE